MYGIGLSNFDKPIFLKIRNNYSSFIQLKGAFAGGNPIGKIYAVNLKYYNNYITLKLVIN